MKTFLVGAVAAVALCGCAGKGTATMTEKAAQATEPACAAGETRVTVSSRSAVCVPDAAAPGLQRVIALCAEAGEEKSRLWGEILASSPAPPHPFPLQRAILGTLSITARLERRLRGARLDTEAPAVAQRAFANASRELARLHRLRQIADTGGDRSGVADQLFAASELCSAPGEPIGR